MDLGKSAQAGTSTALPLIERDNELQRLNTQWQAAVAGRGSVLLMTGEAGLGKTTLVNSFLSTLDGSGGDCKIARAACSAQSGKDEPFWPFAEVMSQLVVSKKKKLGEDVLDAVLDLAPSWTSVIPVAGNVVGASIKTAQVVRARTRVQDMPSPDKLLREYIGALSKVAARKPILIFLDDLHWSDAASVRLLSHLSRNIGHLRVMVLAAYRPSDVAVEGHPLHPLVAEILRYDAEAEIALPPLTGDGVSTLIRRTYPANKFPDTLAATLLDSTGGSPLFLTESMRLMQSRGEILKDQADGRWMLARDLNDDDLPRSVEAVIHKRLERLPDDLQRTLSVAAAQGSVFESAVLAHVLERDELEIMRLLEPAEKVHEVITYVGDVELDHDVTARYRFSSSMFQHELQETLRGKYRMIVHRRTAEGMERLWGEDAADYAPQLARHYETGRLWDRAAHYTILSAKQTRAAGAISQAIALYERAEHLLSKCATPDPAMQFDIDEGLSYLYEIDSSYAQAEMRAMRAMKTGLPALGWRHYATLQMRLATLADNAGQFNHAYDLLQEILQALDASSPDGYSAEAYQLHAQVACALTRISRSDEGIRHAEAALESLAARPQAGEMQALRLRLMSALGISCMAAGNYQRAIAIYENIYDNARALHLMDVLAQILENLAIAYLSVGRYDKSKEINRAMIDTAEKISSESLMAKAHLVAGRSLLNQSKPFAALRQFDEAAHLAAQVKLFASQPELLALRALALVRLDRPGEAAPLLDQAMEGARASGSREWVAYTQFIQAELMLIQGKPQEAVDLAHTAIDVFQEEGSRFYEAVASRALGHAYVRLGQVEQAHAAFQHAHDIFEAIGNEPQAQRTAQEADIVM